MPIVLNESLIIATALKKYAALYITYISSSALNELNLLEQSTLAFNWY
ncbi:hypothetical protein PTRA_b0674 [Pseudoalteromonas translucida KMM 520]|uniref:Uncharacterized protein n=1 Tax=Pseudoalteromonas translucida KMM 520 TaxID=1315283 RepID=A0A0U2WTC6_9GAMM|nr:hypothetical protein PTRA_b0674 [Pseudoalteromonas translucida KMM 520]